MAFIFLSIMHAQATTYYSRNSGVNWSNNNSWSTVAYGGPAAAGHPVAGDTVNIADGMTVFVNTSSACSVINIGQGTSGTLQFGSTANFTLTVSNDIHVYNGAKLYYNSNNARTHTLRIGGDLVNDGVVDLVYDINDRVNIVFNNSTNSVVSGSGSWSLRNVTMNKFFSDDSLEIQSATFEAAIVTLVTTSGTYIHQNSSSYSVNPNSNFVIPENVVFKVPQGLVWFAANSNTLYLEGSLMVNGGSVNAGSTTGNNGLIYRQPAAFVPYLEVSDGMLKVFGGIYNNLADPFSFKMSGGIIFLNTGTSGTSQGVFYQNDLAGSIFEMSGGKIIIEKHNNIGATNVDWGICGNNGIVNTTGGTVQFGDSATPSGTVFDFMVFPSVVQPNFKITGLASAAISLRPVKNATNDFQLLSLYIDTNKTFDIRSISGVSGDSKNMTLTSTGDEVHAFYNNGIFSARTGTVTFTGSSAQAIGGSSITTFYRLFMNSTADVTLENQERVSRLLTMNSGKLVTSSANMLTCTANANATIGSVSSYVVGPMKHTVASAALKTKIFPIGTAVSYRPAVLNINHSNGVSVTYMGEVMDSSAAALGYHLPPSIDKVSSVRYWNFTRQNVANFSNATIQLYYDLDDSVVDRMSVGVVHDDGNSNWLDLGGNGTADYTGSITSGSINVFKTKFALGFPPAPLPVELVSFSAKKSGEKVVCEWATASEISNDYFVIERSADAIHYDSVVYVDGAGNSSVMLYYEATDDQPLTGDSYYRLKQENDDGEFTFSEPVHVFIKPMRKLYKIFPNPADGDFIYISRSGESMYDVKVIVQDVMGKEVPFVLKLSPDNKEMSLDILPSEFHEESFYIVSIVSGEDSEKNKILIRKGNQ
ncbi:MAG: hypothetical protein NT126_08760 [Bacteroidetes bacterium]|nr:hypothetical protein [Bacteroidota bacterium]